MFSIVLARSENKVIGKDNWLPWEIPSDFQHFKRTTLDSIVAMGSKTFDSLGGKPLPRRKNIVFSRNKVGHHNGVDFMTISDFIELYDGKEVFIIGGSEIYNYFMENELVDQAIITEVNATVDGDSFFEHDDVLSRMSLVDTVGPIQEVRDQYEYRIDYYRRK